MLELRKVAITGGLSCGKSSACRFFKELGAYVVSADEIVHQLLSSDKNLTQKIIALMGSDIVVNHQIDRSRIAKKVFSHPQLLKSLEEILHPIVREEVERQYEKIKNNGAFSLFVAEIPLLYETGGESFFDTVIAVFADEKFCKERFEAILDAGKLTSFFTRQSPGVERSEETQYCDMGSLPIFQPQELSRSEKKGQLARVEYNRSYIDGSTESEYEKRASRQLSPLEKVRRADYVILNNNTLADMRNVIGEIFEKLKQKPI